MAWDLWAVKRGDDYWHIGERRWVELHGLSDPLVPVTVAIDQVIGPSEKLAPEKAYYGWQPVGDEDARPRMIFPHRILFEMCFPYGPQAEAERGRGRIVRLLVEKR